MHRFQATTLGALALATSARAAPIELTHQLRLLDASGAPVDGTHDLRLTLWTHATATTEALWSVEFTDLRVEQGYASVVLATGDGGATVNSDWFAGDVWVGVAVDGGTELSPRTALTSAPSAGHAASTSGVRVAPAPASSTCDAAGALQWDSTNQRLLVCNGLRWSGVLTDKTIALESGARRWSDGTVADSCEGYRRPPGGAAYDGATGDGLYRIDPDGTGGAYGEITVYCDQTHHEGGWTLVLSAGIDRNLTSGISGEFTPYPSSAAAPATGALHKMSDAMINEIKTATGAQIAYWVTTPGSGTGLLGAELFHRADCTFQMHRPLASIMATTCHQSTTAFSAPPTWVSGGRWWDNDGGGGYYWAFGQQQRGDHGTGGTCASDGRGLGVHNPTYHPFHRGWCGTQAWGQVWVR